MSLQPTFYNTRKIPLVTDDQHPKSELAPGFTGFSPSGNNPSNSWGQNGTDSDSRNRAGMVSNWEQSSQDKDPASPKNGGQFWSQHELDRDPGAPRKPARTGRFNQNRYSPSRELFAQMRGFLMAWEAEEAGDDVNGGPDKSTEANDFRALDFRHKK